MKCGNIKTKRLFENYINSIIKEAIDSDDENISEELPEEEEETDIQDKHDDEEMLDKNMEDNTEDSYDDSEDVKDKKESEEDMEDEDDDIDTNIPISGTGTTIGDNEYQDMEPSDEFGDDLLKDFDWIGDDDDIWKNWYEENGTDDAFIENDEDGIGPYEMDQKIAELFRNGTNSGIVRMVYDDVYEKINDQYDAIMNDEFDEENPYHRMFAYICNRDMENLYNELTDDEVLIPLHLKLYDPWNVENYEGVIDSIRETMYNVAEKLLNETVTVNNK